jgi:hypothetical protein
VKPSLIKEFVSHPAGEPAPDGSTPSDAWSHVDFDIVLLPE